MKYVYDSTVGVSYGIFYCPECTSKFYAGGPAIHNAGCHQINYDNCEFHFNLKQVNEAIKRAERFQDDNMAYYGVSVAMLRSQFPHLLPEGLR